MAEPPKQEQKIRDIGQVLNLALQHHSAGRLPEAEKIYQQILQADPNQHDALHLLGVIAHQVGKNDIAVELISKALSSNPGNAKAQNNLGNAYMKLGKPDEASSCYQKAIDIVPDYVEALNNLGNALLERGNPEDAVSNFKEALSLQPDHGEVQNNLGSAYMALGRLDEAFACYQKAIALLPGYVEAHNHLATLQLLRGDFKNGWDNYAWRWQAKDFLFRQRKLTQSGPYQGEFDGKINFRPTLSDANKILVWMEQGIGDEIMFASLLPDLMETAETVVVECNERLLPLFERSFPEINFVARREQPSEDLLAHHFDHQMPAGNLGHHFRPDAQSFPHRPAYLRPDKEKQAHIRDGYRSQWPGQCLVGLSWRSGHAGAGTKRSVLVEQLKPLLSQENCTFINLQYGDIEEDLAAFEAMGCPVHRDPHIDPLSDMDTFAAHVAALDLVLSIDNSTVHLAGSLGVPTWVMLPQIPDWRWMLERDDSPWYPTLRLFRQEEPDNWTGVINQVSQELGRFPGKSSD